MRERGGPAQGLQSADASGRSRGSENAGVIYVGEVHHDVKLFKMLEKSSTYYGFHALGQEITKLGGGSSHNVIVTKRNCYCEMCRRLDFHMCFCRRDKKEALLQNHAFEMGWFLRTPTVTRVGRWVWPKDGQTLPNHEGRQSRLPHKC